MVFIFSDCNIFCKLFPCVPWELPSAMAKALSLVESYCAICAI